MAAGLSIAEENVDAFRRRINAQCRLEEEDLQEKITIDVPMPVSYPDEKLADQIELLKPFGKGNPRPLFADRQLAAEGVGVLGKNRNVARMRLRDAAGRTVSAVYFGAADEFAAFAAEHPKIDVVYYPRIDDFRGAGTLQLVITNYRASAGA